MFLQMSNFLHVNLQPKKKLVQPQAPQLADDVGQAAIEEVRRGKSVRVIAEKYQISKSTLHDAVHLGRKNKAGREPYLGKEIEDRIKDWIGNMSSIGYGQARDDIIGKTQSLIKALGISTPWVDDKPSYKWYNLFMNRHPELRKRMTMALDRGRANVMKECLLEWFGDLRQYLITARHLYLLDDPTRIYNADESAFPLSMKSSRVVVDVTKTKKHVYQGGSASSKTTITVMLATSAAGHYIRPMVVYSGVQPRTELREHFHKVMPDAIFANTESGWMNQQLFVDWLQKFNEDLITRRVLKPILLLVDGASVHISIPAGEFCLTNGIYLYTLYPHSTHVTQPLDLALMGSIKAAYHNEYRSWVLENLGTDYSKYHFVELFEKSYRRTATIQNATSGFAKSCIFPWEPELIDASKLYAAEVFDPRSERNRPLPMMIDTSINEGRAEEENIEPTTSNDQQEVEQIDKNVPTEMMINGVLCKVTPLKEKTLNEKVDEVLALPKVTSKKRKLGPARASGPTTLCVFRAIHSKYERKGGGEEVKDRSCRGSERSLKGRERTKRSFAGCEEESKRRGKGKKESGESPQRRQPDRNTPKRNPKDSKVPLTKKKTKLSMLTLHQQCPKKRKMKKRRS